MSRNILPEPPAELKQLSDSLSERIRAEIGLEGMIPFSRYMEIALYEPGLGYYSAGLHKLGESGDFITAPELGSLFAACIARQVAEVAGSFGNYDIVEIGAGSGRLAADLLRELGPDRPPGRYRILERSADLRKVQRELIADTAPDYLDRVEWLDRPPESAWQGVLIANEVLDALAVDRFRMGEHGPELLCVAEQEGKFGWTSRSAEDSLKQAMRPWLDSVTCKMTCGLALFIDYGYPRREYYLPERSDGTLMCHYRHQAHDDVFFWPGLQDITAWVDFTALAEAADACRLEVEGYTSQAMFLLGCGLDRLLIELSGDDPGERLDLNSQVRQLTLPGMMGERFKVMGLGRGLDAECSGFSLQDLRHQL
jgi:SAM-dependent MidA family methyltransferase